MEHVLVSTHESKDVAKNKHIYNKQDIIHWNNFDILIGYIVLDVEEKNEAVILWQLNQSKRSWTYTDYVRRYGSVHGFPKLV